MKMERGALRMVYQVPTAEGYWSERRVYETDDSKLWERAVTLAHRDGYRIVKVERVKEGNSK